MITQSMIDSVIREIEEPLITAEELADAIGVRGEQIRRDAHRLHIDSYMIFYDGKYKAAYDEKQVVQILQYRKKYNGVIRKNKLDISGMLNKV